MITIVDYGMGNSGSIQNMLKRIGVASVITGEAGEVARASKLILPGVGAFDRAMQHIDESGLRQVLDKKVLEERVPVLGICLGMQLLTRSSEEGIRQGLGWIQAATRRLPATPGLKIPHMGWNRVIPTREDPILKNFPEESRFYFVHSYAVEVDTASDSLLKATHGITFDAAVRHENIVGVQFHPEKSHRFGMLLFENFAGL